MRVSPLDIRKQEFTKAFRGYEIEEVNAFLQMIAREFEEARDDHRRLEDQLRGLEEKIRHYERVEEALQEALQTARDSTRKAVQNAEERARLIVRDAESRASEITRDAQSSLETMRAETGRLANRQHEIVARLRAFLTAETEMLNRFERNELDGTSASQQARPSTQTGSDQHATIRPSVTGGRSGERLPQAPTPPSPQVVEDDDDDAEDVFNPAAQESDEDVQPLRGGAFNVRSLIASARAAAHDHSEDEAFEDPDVVNAYVDADDEEDGDSGAGEGEPDDSRGRQATEEIEKIRRILNDLD
jgi:cell division initiation protein